MNKHQDCFKVAKMCNILKIGRSGYYAWRNRKPSSRSMEEKRLKERIGAIYQQAKGRYGHRPIYRHLRDEGLPCGRDRTLKLMKEIGIKGLQTKRYKPISTESKHMFGYRPNLMKQYGKPSACDQIWVADTTYLSTKQGWMYLATIMDLFSRRIIGWSISTKNDSKLVCGALKAAAFIRGKQSSGVIHHSDRGSTYASDQYQKLLSSLNIKSSMSAKGNCYDNASMESFFGRFKTSSIRKHVFTNQQDLRSQVFDYVEVFYNRFRKHSSLNYNNPIQFEEQFKGRLKNQLALTKMNH